MKQLFCQTIMLTQLILLATLSTIPDGSLIFLEHSNNIVENETNSPITHVGIIIKNEVYEADKPKVHKITLDEFRKKNKKYKIYILSPTKPYSALEIKNMKEYLDKQIKRRYSIWGYVFGKEVNGIHCGELVSESLNKSGRYNFSEPWDVVPGDLWNIKNYVIHSRD